MFGLSIIPGIGLQNTWSFLSKKRDKGDFCYINEVTFRPAPKNGGSLPVGTFIPTSRPLERGEGLEAEINCPCPMISSIMPMIEASVKTQKVGFRELQGW